MMHAKINWKKNVSLKMSVFYLGKQVIWIVIGAPNSSSHLSKLDLPFTVLGVSLHTYFVLYSCKINLILSVLPACKHDVTRLVVKRVRVDAHLTSGFEGTTRFP